MIDDDGHARIIDFGQSRILTPDLPDVGPTKTACSLHWCAPELFFMGDSQSTYASDVYSWACTVLEVCPTGWTTLKKTRGSRLHKLSS